MKHCATCRYWFGQAVLDTGICTAPNMQATGSEPDLGGVATYADIITSALFGCVNWQEEKRNEKTSG